MLENPQMTKNISPPPTSQKEPCSSPKLVDFGNHWAHDTMHQFLLLLGASSCHEKLKVIFKKPSFTRQVSQHLISFSTFYIDTKVLISLNDKKWKVKLCINILNHTISLLGMYLSKKFFLVSVVTHFVPHPPAAIEGSSDPPLVWPQVVWHLLVTTPQLSFHSHYLDNIVIGKNDTFFKKR